MDQSDPVSVSIVLPSELAHLPACQHTLWMLVNLLARADGIVDRIVVAVPPGVPQVTRVVPLAPRGLDLRSAVLTGAASVDSVPVSDSNEPDESASFRFAIGPGSAISNLVRVHGENWWGGFSHGQMPGDGRSALPFGPYAAAALAASEVFKAVRLKSYRPLASVFYSLWTLTVSDSPSTDPDWTGPSAIRSACLEAVVAGVGAVGSAWVHAVWATRGLDGTVDLADSDDVGVDTTNLNRSPIFSRQSVGRPKASEAAMICADAEVRFRAHDDTVGSISPRRPMTMLVSAVDTNRSRQSVQSLYPARIVSGSTHNLRAEVLRCDPIGEAPCLHCHNPPEPEGDSDADKRRRFLAMSEAERLEVANELGVDLDQAIQWATDATCGFIGDQLLAHLHPSESRPEAFAVGFVSVMAGTMLAALSVQEAMDSGPLGGRVCRAVFQSFDPLNQTTNSPRPYERQRSCSMCDPATRAVGIWRKRFWDFSSSSD